MMLRKPTEKLTPDDIAAMFLMFSYNLVKNARRDLEKGLNPEQARLDKATEELMFFCFFAFDYWISDGIDALKERQAVREALSYHWREMLSGDNEGQTMLCILQQRLKEYAHIVNEERSDQAKFLGFGRKLSEFCGLPLNPYLLVLAPDLFTAAMNAVYKIEWDTVKTKT